MTKTKNLFGSNGYEVSETLNRRETDSPRNRNVPTDKVKYRIESTERKVFRKSPIGRKNLK